MHDADTLLQLPKDEQKTAEIGLIVNSQPAAEIAHLSVCYSTQVINFITC